MADEERKNDAAELAKLHGSQIESIREAMRSPANKALANIRVDLFGLSIPSIEIGKGVAVQMKGLSKVAELSRPSTEMLSAMKRVAEDDRPPSSGPTAMLV